MKKLIISVCDSRVSYVFIEDDKIGVYDYIKDSEEHCSGIKDDNHLIPLSAIDICEDFAQEMIKNHSLYTPYEFNRLSGDYFNDYQIVLIDNQKHFKSEKDTRIISNIYIKRS